MPNENKTSENSRNYVVNLNGSLNMELIYSSKRWQPPVRINSVTTQKTTTDNFTTVKTF
jgi:hypothetical protein